ncbi:MAG TPA: DUF4258 domain-containing protein [Isosphaeraceae bacterium]|nr:DUF4258 domain-containing protein [Isosphaeraceae bacterium]
MAIERFQWTEHAEQRLGERRLARGDVERATRDGHGNRQINAGRADWLLTGITAEKVPFEAVYDHPADGDAAVARVVSAWRLDQPQSA